MLKEIYPDTARSGFTTMRWYDTQMEGALSLLGTTKMDVAAYGTLNINSSGVKLLRLEMRNGKKYWFYNFEGLVQVAEVTTEEQLAEQEMFLKLMFG